MSRLHFYASPADLLVVCKTVEAKLALKILPTFEVPEEDHSGEFAVYHRFENIPDLGYAQQSNRLLAPVCVVIDRDTPIEPGPVERLRGNVVKRFVVVNTTSHDGSVEFRPAGEFIDGTIIMGEIMSQMPSKASERIMRAFRTAMQKHFGKTARGAWVSPGTIERIKAGGRATSFYDHSRPELMDVNLDELSQ
jgi:hypothetical protein